MVRLQKFLAEAGLTSRRGGEQLILDGRVEVNGEVVRVLGSKVELGRDRVAVDGQLVRPKRKQYIALNKPPGYVCTRRDPEKRLAIGNLLPAEWDHLFSVGRLDTESEGLIFLTNDGEFCLKMTHPRYGVRKTYRVTVKGRVDSGLLERVLTGVTEGGEHLQAEAARILSTNNTRSLLELVLAEGRNREVRRLLEALELQVERLQRTQIGPIKLGELPIGRWRTLTETEIESLLKAYENKTVALGAARSGVGIGGRPRPGGSQRSRTQGDTPSFSLPVSRARTSRGPTKPYQRARPSRHKQRGDHPPQSRAGRPGPRRTHP